MPKRLDWLVFTSAFFLVTATLLLSGYLGSRVMNIEAALQRHSFDRTLVIQSSNNPQSSLGMRDGARALLSRASAAQLLQLPQVQTVHATSFFNQDLQLSDGRRMPVFVMTIPSGFASEFALGDPAELKGGRYVASQTLAARLQSSGTAVLLPSQALVAGVEQALPAAAKGSLNWDTAKLAIQLSTAAFALPAGSARFDQMLFNTEQQSFVTMPQLSIRPEVNLFVKLAPGVTAEQGLQALREFLASAAPAEAGLALNVRAASEFFAEDFNQAQLRQWQARLQWGMTALSLGLLLLLGLQRLPRMRQEIALRRAAGAPWVTATNLACRPSLLGLGLGLAAGLLWAGLTMQLTCPKVLPQQGPMMLQLGLLAGVGMLLLLLSALFVGRTLTLNMELRRAANS